MTQIMCFIKVIKFGFNGASLIFDKMEEQTLPFNLSEVAVQVLNKSWSALTYIRFLKC
jgi:hypothetical protein